ncbi:putative thiazole biosynthetic enzyme [Ensifer sp. M14]|uniref:FAD-dependent oxidoreductase n=1 Tax=Sinorhizobium/Ensifer group TaxID=227292 RepID=UPI00098571D3|nr:MULTISPECIES: FAD-dependent oxidoreductase [Sinorhizobium/Ensifer group]OOG69734.1 invasion protein [Sinorhizobium sp. A49]RDL46542.1 putative thiazole biosynthetic enzyme [Ensifer sp. M14]
METIREPLRNARIVDRSDVVVVGGGPAGISAAVSAARTGASVTLLERYPYVGGLAAGGMVLVLDDMVNSVEITVRGICMEMIERMKTLGLCVTPTDGDRQLDLRDTPEAWRRWARWGLFDFHTPSAPHPICYAAAFDPDAFKRVAYDILRESGVKLRTHSWFSSAIVENNTIKGVVCQTKAGREAIMGDVVIDASGDLDVAADAGAQHTDGNFILTTVSRWGGIDTEAAERFEFEDPERFKMLDHEAKRLIGGCWSFWWLKTPLPGVIWLNCPHMPKLSGLSVEDLTYAELEGRTRIARLLDFARANLPGFENAHVIDFAPQTGVRQSRLLQGEYVVTKDDVMNRRHFADTVCRGRDYYTPYRAMLPKEVDQLIVAGRHYSATIQAQKSSREIPPCMAMGEAAGVAATVALNAGVKVRDADVRAIQKQLRAQGADPGDIPSENATYLEAAE